MLPVDEVLPDLRAALRARGEAVLVAPPGAGKTTRVPVGLLDEPWAQAGKIILLSPRRIAARAAASRMASERGERVGDTVGYRVRLDSRIGPKTRIEVVTEGVFTRMILDDPELTGVAAVLFDEFHERSLEGDLGLALARDAQGALRPDLKIVVMSATLDAARVTALLGDAPVIASEGRMFPVDVRYRPRDPNARLEEEVAASVRLAISSEFGSALVFLPGAREIERTAEILRTTIRDPLVDVRPLYGAMSPQEQDEAIAPAPAGRRKIVLATSIAETSLTIEGVRIVVDAGMSRRARYEPVIGMTRLETVRASQAAIAQRTGRAGRTEPGVCWRLWSEGETRALAPFDPPEIVDSDLSGLALDLALWGVRDPSTLAWLDPPPQPSWGEARVTLWRVGAFDDADSLTERGRKLARLPLPPRLANMVVASAPEGDGLLAAYMAVLLTERGLGGRDTDLTHRLSGLLADRSPRAKSARLLAERLARDAGARGEDVNPAHAGAVLARGFEDRIAKVRGPSGPDRLVAFQLAIGRGAVVADHDSLAREKYLVVADASGSPQNTRILAAAPITLPEIEAQLAARVQTETVLTIDEQTGAAKARRVRRYMSLVLSEAPVGALAGEELREALFDHALRTEFDALEWGDEVDQLQARVMLMRELEGEAWPDWGFHALLNHAQEWLYPALDGVKRLKDVDVKKALLAWLPYDLRRRLDAEAPATFETPAGSELRINYTSTGGPTLSVRLQELFGLDKHPSVANGRVPLTLLLLSPAQRPVQTTKDLPGFWRGSYAAVRSEMRGRYPKHPWPEDPLSAPPTRRAKPRGS
jgi:ATP-dependent helicase HrpB